MTTDNFTEAADKAADHATRSFIGNNDAAYGYSIGHTDGAEWARDHLTAQEPTVAEVLAVRTALADQMPQNWWGGEQWYRYAQEAVAAARAARRDEEKR